MAARRGAGRKTVDFDTVRSLALALPAVEEYVCYGTPALRVKKKLLARLREDGATLVVKCEDSRRELLMQLDPRAYFMEEHYRGHPVVLVSLPRIDAAALQRLLEHGWEQVAPKTLLAARNSKRT